MYRSPNYCDITSRCSFNILKAIAKSNENLFVIPFKSKKEQQLLLSRYFKSNTLRENNQEKKQKRDIKNQAKVKSNNIRKSNIEKSPILLLQYWEDKYFMAP